MWTGFKNTPGTMFFAYSQDPGKTPLRGDGCDVQFGSAQRCLMPWWSDPFGVYEQIVVLNPGKWAAVACCARHACSCAGWRAALPSLGSATRAPNQPPGEQLAAVRCICPICPALPAMCAVGVEQWGTKWTYSLLNLGGSSSAVLCKQPTVRTQVSCSGRWWGASGHQQGHTAVGWGASHTMVVKDKPDFENCMLFSTCLTLSRITAPCLCAAHPLQG